MLLLALFIFVYSWHIEQMLAVEALWPDFFLVFQGSSFVVVFGTTIVASFDANIIAVVHN